ncbi:CRISPR-associated helicase Cas3' [Mariniluteicoccus flavus]
MTDASSLPDGSDKSAETEISAPARAVWAKSGARAQEWLPLVQHVLDSEAMAERLYDTWLAPGIKERWGAAFPGGRDDARATFVFLASSHDVGKGSPVFAAQVETLAERARGVGLECPPMDSLRDDRVHLPHGTVSFLALREWLLKQGVDRPLAEQLAGVVGAHHGKPVGKPHKTAAAGRDFATGGAAWASVRTELLEWIDRRQGFSARIAGWGSLRIPLPVQIGMCGLVIMADWLASNQDYFGLIRADADLSPAIPPVEDQTARWDDGWAEVGMPVAWAPPEPDQDASALYRDRFGWDDREPRPLQRAIVDIVRNHEPSLLIVESGMGSGKTEAAFAAAEILAARWGAHGIFVALPTQATTDAMFTRMLKWLERLPEPPADVPASALVLAHGKASLNSEYAAQTTAFDEFLCFDGDHSGIAGVNEEGESAVQLTNAVAHQWFRGRKRRLLANFGIGTIDQVLMAALQQKHLMMRHLALAGKVVVIDEVHASDDFMNVYLDSVLHWLGHYGVPVILLSATLTQERKKAMLHAYAPQAIRADGIGYPLLTWVSGDRAAITARPIPDHSEPRTVTWDWIDEDDIAIVTHVTEDLSEGGCALVVRNTVKDAQRLAELFTSTGDIPVVVLAHSRFLSADRAANDARLLELFGPSSGAGSRPDRAVVVATQVVEQSLDVDFDLLVTDLAPMDLLFQRIGRLHRHAWRRRPDRLSRARVRIIGTPEEGLRRGSAGSRFVYGEHALLRTALVLEEQGHELTLSGDIAPLVERALGSGDVSVPEPLRAELAAAEAKARAESERRREDAKQSCLGPWRPEGDSRKNLGDWLTLTTDPSEARLNAMVRDAKPSLEVIVVPVHHDGASAIVPPWMSDGGVLDVSTQPDDATARRIASWTVKLPSGVTPSPKHLDDALTELRDHHARGWAWHHHRLIKGQPILPMRQQTEGSTILEATLFADRTHPVRLRYTPEQGLEELRDDIQPAG